MQLGHRGSIQGQSIWISCQTNWLRRKRGKYQYLTCNQEVIWICLLQKHWFCNEGNPNDKYDPTTHRGSKKGRKNHHQTCGTNYSRETKEMMSTRLGTSEWHDMQPFKKSISFHNGSHSCDKNEPIPHRGSINEQRITRRAKQKIIKDESK